MMDCLWLILLVKEKREVKNLPVKIDRRIVGHLLWDGCKRNFERNHLPVEEGLVRHITPILREPLSYPGFMGHPIDSACYIFISLRMSRDVKFFGLKILSK